MDSAQSKKIKRSGFKKVPDIKEWSVVGDTFIWQESLNTSIKYNELPFSRPDLIEPSYQNENEWIRTFIAKTRRREELLASDRYEIMQKSYEFSPMAFFKIAPPVLTSTNWSDVEKLYLLISKLPFICGFRYGKEVEALLSTIRWKSKSFRSRMVSFYDTVRSCGIDVEDYESMLVLDEATVKSFGDKVSLYRGFLVPANESIRDKDVSKWLKQETGKSVYFTIDMNIAEYFAAIQKYNVMMSVRGMQAKDISKKTRDCVEAKIAIAKYEVAIDNIILFDDYLGRKESECICLPNKTDLINYKFMGFDDFVRIIKAGRPQK